MSKLLVISCLFAEGPFDIYPAPEGDRRDCVFFTNSDAIGRLAEQRGWKYCKAPFPKGTRDSLELALFSKAIKYLQFIKDPYFSDWRFGDYHRIVYFDHKLRMFAKHVDSFVALANTEKLVIRSTPRGKDSIWQEVDDAKVQERYTRHMDLTKAYIDMLLRSGFSPDTLIANTGLILYNDIPWARDLTQRVYNACTMLQQPECQILWALHAQSFQDGIKMIPWDHPAIADVHWENPVSQGQALLKRSVYSRAKSKLKRLLR